MKYERTNSVDEFIYEPEGDEYIAMERWGKDHYSTLAYLETRAVDCHGKINNPNMRCDARLHRHFAHGSPISGMLHDGSKYPTRLRGDETVEHHDDWSCAEDMAAAGLLKMYWRIKRHGEVFGDCEARIEFTPLGYAIAGQLRAWRADGGMYRDFVPAVDLARAGGVEDTTP